jgi:hypothetical protein
LSKYIIFLAIPISNSSNTLYIKPTYYEKVLL